MADENDGNNSVIDNTQDNTQQNDAGNNQQQQGDEGLDKGSFGNEDLDGALSKLMGVTDAKRPPAQGTQQQGEGQQPARNDDGRLRDAQGRFIEGGTPAKGAGQQQQPRGQQPQRNQPIEQIPPQARKFGTNYWSDERGNIHDAKGNLVAPAGAGHSQFRRIFPYIQSLEQEVTSTKQRMQSFEDANQLARAANLTLEDQGAALQLMVQWRKDPVNTIKTLLQLAQQGGIDVSPIQQGGGGIDANTARTLVKEILTEALAPFQPIVEQTRAQREREEAMSAVIQEHNAFLQEFPDAAPHQDALANVMRDRNVSAREAYFMLRAFAAEQRLDFTKDLATQLQARQRGNGQQQRAPIGGGQNRPLPDMSGRNNGSNANGYVPEGSRQPAGANDSWDSIAEKVLGDYGLSRG